MFYYRDSCRSCGGAVSDILDLGVTPIADALTDVPVDASAEVKVPLHLCLCNDCLLLQIREDVSPDILFAKDYPYYSSVNNSLKKHFRESAQRLIRKYSLQRDSLVLEIACNDGVMLEVFQEAGIQTLGVDPAQGPVNVARNKGLDVICAFFNSNLAADILRRGHSKADLILGNNVLAHVPDPNELLKGAALLLKPGGKVVIEVPYAVDMLDKTEFDTIFHQHYSYFSVISLIPLFERNGLYINEIERISMHGGSLRVTASFDKTRGTSVTELLDLERKMSIERKEAYQQFSQDVAMLKKKVLDQLDVLKRQGSTIQGYGAAGKANTLMSYFGIGKNYIDYIADISEHKQGKYFPSNHLPILPPRRILQDQPDYVFILAWNFADEIMEQMKEYKSRGGKFIIPIPFPRIV